MTQQETIDLFELKTDQENIHLNKFKQLPCQIVNRTEVNQDLSVQDFIYDYKQGFMAVVIQNSSELSKLGRVWSIIEPEILGEFQILKRTQNDQTNRIEYKQIHIKQYEEKILSIAYLQQKNKFIYGFHNGKISVFDMNIAQLEQSKNNELFLSDEPILFMNELKDNKLLVITTQSIKVLEFGMIIDIVSGGSLKKRLGQSVIQSQFYNNETQKLYLGTSYGQVLIFNLSDCKPQFIYSFEINDQRKINGILFKKGNLFIAHDRQVSIYSQKNNPLLSFKQTAELKLSQEYNYCLDYNCYLTVIEYYQSQKIFITGYSNGLIIYWNSMTGEVSGAQQVSDSKINKIVLFPDYEVFMVCTEDGQLITLKFGSLNL